MNSCPELTKTQFFSVSIVKVKNDALLKQKLDQKLAFIFIGLTVVLEKKELIHWKTWNTYLKKHEEIKA